MRPNKLEDLRRERVRWRKQAEERQRFQDKKEEAWEFSCRHATPRPKIREEFEHEFKQKVHEVVCSKELRKLAQRENANWKPGGEQRKRGKGTPTPNAVTQGTRYLSEPLCHHF